VTMMNSIAFRSLNKNQGAKLHAQLGRPEFQTHWEAFTECPECGKTIQNQSLRWHCIQIHLDKLELHCHPEIWSPEVARGVPDQEYVAYWNAADDGTACWIPCPDPSCNVVCFSKPSDLQSHWASVLHKGTLKIYDNCGSVPVESKARFQCPNCKVWRNDHISQIHKDSAFCRGIFERRKASERVAHQAEEEKHSPLKHNGTRLSKVKFFLYLGWMLSATNNDTMVVQGNIAKAKRKWAEMHQILSSKLIMMKTYVHFYQSIVLNVLLYRSETWKIT